ncbi:molybdenum cofactor biosynthesis prote [Fomitiporia mediterranea MF3/22]|uniref:molybdenum cofactor biosynthesis prote n=1 Tax=Fomitiporia mediterranea (strain MF3/22) TaxID=694068 RepID=UPI00044082A8|nr:molybdenum cofactor biosynthesis prote [Fomitiporia mediterranea MF3/22]EJD03785.1 molybdenum cofactor biosynthesis prote [Fomitiporia mediterranea MF3/22]
MRSVRLWSAPSYQSRRALHTVSQAQPAVLDTVLGVRERARVSALRSSFEIRSLLGHPIKNRIAAVDLAKPEVPALHDSFHRRHDYLRISLTERCNLRCFYCMPSEGTELSPPASILSDDEVVRLASLFVKNGVNKIRLTGGEPTVRKGIIELVGRLKELRQFGLKSIAMTTNGIALHRKLPALVDNGLTHLNLSLDTLDPFKFELMTRRMGHDAILRSLDLALHTPGLHSVKLNVVVIRGLNDNEVPKFIELTQKHPLSVRFIEFMPFNGNKWDKQKMVPSSVLLERISAVHPGVYKLSDEVNDTARSYQVPGYRGSFGFISSMSDHFCGTCNRLRLTADGQIKVCLFDSREVSLRDLMRNGAADDNLVEVVRAALGMKKEKHAGMEDIDVVHNRPMIKIGDKKGRPAMVDVSKKEITHRSATAQGRIFIPKVAYDLICKEDSGVDGDDCELKRRRDKAKAKGDVLTVAQLAGIMGSKKTSDLIPLCHPIPLNHVSVELLSENHPPSNDFTEMSRRYSVLCQATAICDGKTGVEMEALTAVSVSLLTVWDMLKAVAGKEMMIDGICLIKKSGGKNSDFVRNLEGKETH